MGWKNYFKVIRIIPGPVVTRKHGEIDLSQDNISLEIIQDLYENDSPYLELTPEGIKALYLQGADQKPPNVKELVKLIEESDSINQAKVLARMKPDSKLVKVALESRKAR